MSFFKIDGNGVYRSCPGLTFICFLQGREEDQWRAFYDMMRSQPVFCRHYQPLPLASLHTTVRGWMVDSKGLPAVFLETYLRDFTRLARASDVCARHGVAPVASAARLYCSSILFVELQLEPASAAGVAALAADLDKLGVPPEHYSPHMTLAYQFRTVPDESVKELQQEVAVLAEALQQLLARPECGRSLRFQPAALCYFPDMTEFVPLLLPDRQ
jgi:hypothetical protein